MYAAAAAVVTKHSKGLAKHLSKNAGHSMGERLKDGITLGSKSTATIRVGQVFNLQLAFADVDAGPNRRQHHPRTYTLVVADTVAVRPVETSILKRRHGVYEHAHVLTKRFPATGTFIHRRSQKFQNDILPFEILCHVFEKLDLIARGRASQVVCVDVTYIVILM